jgi:hypothetical protein
MVAKTFYATKAMRHPIYRTRMLQAGDVVEMSGPLGPAFLKMGILTDKAPRRAAPKVEATPAEPKAEAKAEAPKPKAKAAARKRTRKTTKK